MLKMGPICLLAVFVLMGALGAFIINPQKPATLLLLFVPPAAIVSGFALVQSFQKFRELKKHLVWWHVLWLLTGLSSLVFRIRDIESIKDEPVDLWAVYRILLVGIVALVLLSRLLVKRPDWVPSLFRGLVGALSVYALISIVSTLWSVYPAWSLYKSVEYLVDIALLGAIIATVRSVETYKTLFDWTWVLQAGLLGTVWAGALLWPSKAFVVEGNLIHVRLSGVLPALDQNDVGLGAAFLAIVALTRLQFPSRPWPADFLLGCPRLQRGHNGLVPNEGRRCGFSFGSGSCSVLLKTHGSNNGTCSDRRLAPFGY